MYSQTFDATGARTSSTLATGSGTASNFGAVANGFGEGVTLAYDAATGGYTVTDAGGASATFLPSMKDPGSSDDQVTTFAKASGSTSDQLVLFNPGSANTLMALTYVSYGAWQHTVTNGATADLSQQYFVYGIRQDANQPSTGSGSYAITVDGIWSNPDGIYTLSSQPGASTFTANFTNKTVSTTLQLDGTNATVPGDTKSLGRFNGTGTIAAMGGGFAGTLTHQGTDGNGNTLNGSFAGAFFGPQGQEVGYTFSLRDPTGSGGTAAGAVVGKAQ
ncbi:transferrin-binding protein-like solute binding protein [Sphingomonas sp.]|uniref:transferrin-binding protein-like solute binding protein n=1 Tax=Sphingomonas sp. TaxID=28214 RepID=UPI002DB7EF39|nr:transferrin-binding protein-like solute binding protein [Sphingomonas sp.]HEU4970285.1 transferrin-binding protein-like solute binding protein [Sphingomonas sp.]